MAIEPGSTPPAWDGEDWCAYFEERAAIAEHDGGLDRAAAERRALDCTVVEWLNRNPPPAQPDPSRCLLCGEAEARGRPLLPIPTGDGGHRWLRDVCLEPHWRARLAEAVEALARLKIGRTRRNEEQGL